MNEKQKQTQPTSILLLLLRNWKVMPILFKKLMQDVTTTYNTVKCMLFPRLVWWLFFFFFVMVYEPYYVKPIVYKQRFEAACDELRPNFLIFFFFLFL